jgi:hypothetical protein
MDEQLKKVLMQFLQLMLDGIEKGTKFAGEQIPLVVQEKLRYELASFLAWAGFWLVLIITLWVVAEWGRRYHMSERERDEATFPIRIGCLIASFILALPMLYELDWALYVYLAPRVYILDWLRFMLK